MANPKLPGIPEAEQALLYAKLNEYNRVVLLLLVAAFRAQKVIKVGVCVTAPFLRIGKPDVMERENSAFKDGKPGLGGGRAGLLGK